jgi:crotonobetainyl-CoA:carnitine CoA-transferase CaiB-like acyl-CoA transferase
MALGALEAVWWRDFCEAVGREDLIPEPFREGADQEAVLSEVQRIFVQRTRDEWIEFFADKNLCCEPVNTLEEALALPVVSGRGMIWEVDHPTAGRLEQIGLPLRSSAQSSRAQTPPPLLGQHTIEILDSLGYDDDRIGQLRARRVVAAAEDIAARRKRRS